MLSILFYLPTIIFAIMAIALAVHHYFIHRDPKNPKNFHAQSESCSYICFLQPSDVSNHETWIVASLTAALTWLICLTSIQTSCSCT